MNAQSIFFRFKLHHVLFWLMIFGVWYYLRYDDYSQKPIALWITLVKVLDLALMVYIANYLLVPKLLYNRKYTWFVVSLLSMIIISSYIKLQIIGRILDADVLLNITSENLKVRIYDNLIPHFFLVLAGVAGKVMYDHSQMQQQLNVLAREKAEAELSFLKSQINPHFLFNSLNSVYFLIDKDNTEARIALHRFSEMLRYQLYEMNGSQITIEKEIQYLNDYVHLQRLRKDENYHIEFSSEPEVKNFSIEPLLLIPFVENAFKHISHQHEKENYISLEMKKNNGQFIFNIKNSKEPGINDGTRGGIGLKNVKRRLELLYFGKHELNISDHKDSFNVELKISV